MISQGTKDVQYHLGVEAKGTVVAPEQRILHYWRARAWSRVGVVVIFVILIIVVSVVVSTRFDGSVHISATYLSPGDTRLVSPSSTLCESITLNNPSSTVSATVFLLHRKPIIAARDNFTVTDQFQLARYRDYRYKSFYMYPGSSYTLSSCLTSGMLAYYVIKGTGNFEKWINTLYASEPSVLHYSDKCGVANRTTNKMFTSEDQYYFVFFNTYPTTSNVHVMLTINSVGYLPHSGGVVDTCTASPTTSSCSLVIPHGSDYTFLVETSPPTNGRWDTSVDVATTCDPRVWVYVISVLAPLLGIAAITASVAIAMCCCVKVRPFGKDAASTEISVQTASTTPISSADVIVVESDMISERAIPPTAGQKVPPTTESNNPQQFALSTWTADIPPPSYSASTDPPAK